MADDESARKAQERVKDDLNSEPEGGCGTK